MPSEDHPPNRRGFKARVSDAAGAIFRAAASAGELLSDPHLRRRGAALLIDEASKGLQGIQRGLEEGANNAVNMGVKQVQSVLRDIERKVADFQRQQRRDHVMDVDFLRRHPVDVQIGDQVFEDMPQEMRSRLYYVISARPDLADALREQSLRCGSSSAGAGPPRHVRRTVDVAAPPGGESAEPEGPGGSEGPWPLSQGAEQAAAEEGGAAGDGRGQQEQHHEERQEEGEPEGRERGEDPGVAGGEGGEARDGEEEEGRVPGSAGAPLGSHALAGSSLRHGSGLGADGKAGAPGDGSEEGASSPAPPLVEPPGDEGGGDGASGAAAAPQREPAAAPDAAAKPGIPTADDASAATASSSLAAAASSLSAAAGGGSGEGLPDLVPTAASAAARAPPCAPHPWDCTFHPSAPDPWAASGMARQGSGGGGGGDGGGGGGGGEGGGGGGSGEAGGDGGGDGGGGGGEGGGPDGGAEAGPDASGGATGGAAPGAPQRGGRCAGRPSQSQVSDDWEVLSREAVGGAVGDSGAVETVETVRTLAQSLLESAPLDAARANQAALFEAMLQVPWEDGQGIPDAVEEGGEYSRLVSTPPGEAVQRCMGGVEPIDDIIARDLGRTFPEHPLFVSGEGQARLGRLLRAYALHDDEIGYCQGQAFAAGLLLMYVPEEVAYRLYCRLLDDPPGGAGLRRLYQPGLDPLKLELSRFELLLSSHLPDLHSHLQAAGLPAVLYASQWFMTLYASPFPLHFGGRILDVLLQSGSDSILPRVALALLEALQSELLSLDDFEAIITAVKVTPLQWPVHVYRHVLDRALSPEFISNAELEAARDAAVAEAARLGRPSSFTTRRLLRTFTDGGTERVELLPPLADGEAAGGATAAAEGAPDAPGHGMADSSGSGGAAWAASGGLAAPVAGAAAAAGAGPAVGSFADLSELDNEFEAILHDLHLILPGGSSSDDEQDGRAAGAQQGRAQPQQHLEEIGPHAAAGPHQQ